MRQRDHRWLPFMKRRALIAFLAGVVAFPPAAAGESKQLRARRDPTVRCELQGAPGALRAGTGGLRSVPTEKDAGAFVTRSATGLDQTRDEGGGLCPTNQMIQPM
jgi:hypothetical protein